MWLLNVETRRLEYFTNERSAQVPYAILSHTWGQDEVTFDEMMHNNRAIRSKKGYNKIDYTCQQAIEDNLSYCWIDTICINKSSSAELSEAINSMYRWYRSSIVCYAYLVDVHGDCHCLDDIPFQRAVKKADLRQGQGWISQFVSSHWHTRSWTLQELIAPSVVRFYGKNWNYLGSKGRQSEPGGQWSKKKYLRPLLSYITNIDEQVLEDSTELTSISVARKLSWASQRQATRIEDQAYSLLGIFDISMPLLYGEAQNAFIRLQHEIAKTSNDLSILAWLPKVASSERLLARLPMYFRDVGNVVPITRLFSRETIDVTYTGMRVNVPIFRRNIHSAMTMTWIILNCRYADDLTGPMAARISFRDPKLNLPDATFNHNEYYEASLSLYHHPRLEVISIEECKHARMQCLLLTQDLQRDLGQSACINALPGFWLKLPSSPAPGFHISDTHPEMEWNYETGVLCPRSRDIVETFVTFETPWKTRVKLDFKFTSSMDFWVRQRAVHRLDWGYRLTLNASEEDLKSGPVASLSLPPTGKAPEAGILQLANGERLSIELERNEVMGTLVFMMKISHPEAANVSSEGRCQPDLHPVEKESQLRPIVGLRSYDLRTKESLKRGHDLHGQVTELAEDCASNLPDP